jgi:hypothetical protein
MMEIVSFVKTNGLSGLALVLVYFLNQDVVKLKAELSDCNREKTEIMRPFVRPQANNKEQENKMPLLAIITQPITLKNIEDERS